MSAGAWSFLDAFTEADPMVRRDGVVLSARDVRIEAARLKQRLAATDGPVYLYCEDSGNFLAGLIAALSAGRDVLMPGHAAPGYLAEIGATGASLVTDVVELDSDATLVDVKETLTGVASSPLSISGRPVIGFFTSGSTGAPKICIKSQAQILSETAVQLNLWGAPQGPVIGTVSHQHIYGLLFRVFWPLMAGRPIEALRQELWEAVAHRAHPGCVIISSPAHLSRIPDALELLHCPTHVFSSGGPLALASAKDALVKLGRTPVEVLGSTETGGVAWRMQEREGVLWTPLPQVEITADEEGALAVRSTFTGSDDFVVMGDQVTRHADGRFSLHARLDRIVKIEGKRVSLPRVEEALRALEEIVDASVIDLPDRNGALGAVVVVARGGLSALTEQGPFRFSRLLRRALSVRLEPMELPRLWRFVEHVPENAQGKRPVSDLRALFADRQDDVPTILKREVAEGSATFELSLEPDLRWFEGHFPGQPILPGVAQLHIASVLAEETWGIIATGADMARVKFRRVMQPGDRVTLTLTRSASDRLDFKYLVDGDVTASGAIKGLET
tara:strand:+ start:8675 stop:10354 length:1680 start_codon:yes stop_codon:yes gene_type:complete